jgi:hypothetical protein
MTTYNLAGPRFSSAAFSDPRGVPADFNEPHNAPHNAPYNAPLIGEAAQLGMNASLFLQYFCSRTSRRQICPTIRRTQNQTQTADGAAQLEHEVGRGQNHPQMRVMCSGVQCRRHGAVRKR